MILSVIFYTHCPSYMRPPTGLSKDDTSSLLCVWHDDVSSVQEVPDVLYVLLFEGLETQDFFSYEKISLIDERHFCTETVLII